MRGAREAPAPRHSLNFQRRLSSPETNLKVGLLPLFFTQLLLSHMFLSFMVRTSPWSYTGQLCYVACRLPFDIRTGWLTASLQCSCSSSMDENGQLTGRSVHSENTWASFSLRQTKNEVLAHSLGKQQSFHHHSLNCFSWTQGVWAERSIILHGSLPHRQNFDCGWCSHPYTSCRWAQPWTVQFTLSCQNLQLAPQPKPCKETPLVISPIYVARLFQTKKGGPERLKAAS